MNRIPKTHASRGFALMEALLALLLLAVTVGSAGSMLVESMAGQRSALQRTRAADLAADLAEALRAAPDAASATAEIVAWQAAVQRLLPGAASEIITRPPPTAPGAVPAGIDIHLRWSDGRANRALLLLPVALDSRGS